VQNYKISLINSYLNYFLGNFLGNPLSYGISCSAGRAVHCNSSRSGFPISCCGISISIPIARENTKRKVFFKNKN